MSNEDTPLGEHETNQGQKGPQKPRRVITRVSPEERKAAARALAAQLRGEMGSSGGENSRVDNARRAAGEIGEAVSGGVGVAEGSEAREEAAPREAKRARVIIRVSDKERQEAVQALAAVVARKEAEAEAARQPTPEPVADGNRIAVARNDVEVTGRPLSDEEFYKEYVHLSQEIDRLKVAWSQGQLADTTIIDVLETQLRPLTTAMGQRLPEVRGLLNAELTIANALGGTQPFDNDNHLLQYVRTVAARDTGPRFLQLRAKDILQRIDEHNRQIKSVLAAQQNADVQAREGLESIGAPASVDAAQEAEWLAMGREWVRIANDEQRLETNTALDPAEREKQQEELIDRRETIFKQIATRHPASVGSDLFYAQQGYHYFFLRSHDQQAWKEHREKVKGANDAQDKLLSAIEQMGADAVTSIPTGKLKDALPEIEELGQEVKIHLMPTIIQEPKALDMLLSLLDAQPELRDKIQVMKMRQVNNGTADELPEVVMYTSRDDAAEIVAALQQHFFGMTGAGRVPRFNEAVEGTNGFIYLAESGGDLKQSLRGMDPALLDKIFDQGSNHARIRPEIGLPPVK